MLDRKREKDNIGPALVKGHVFLPLLPASFKRQRSHWEEEGRERRVRAGTETQTRPARRINPMKSSPERISCPLTVRNSWTSTLLTEVRS